MAISKQDKHELDQMHSDWSERYGGCKEDYFACIYLANKLRCDVPKIAGQIAFGGNDYGLDAYFIDPPSKNLYLYQFKWSENHNLFKDSLDRLARDGMMPWIVLWVGPAQAVDLTTEHRIKGIG